MLIESKRKITLTLASLGLLVAVGTASGLDVSKIKSLYSWSLAANTKQTTTTDTCKETAGKLIRQGFTHVFATDCTGYQFAYNGFRGETEVTIVYNTRNDGHTVITK